MKTGHPDAVMCSYNGVNGDYACENTWLLHDVLKGEWKFPGFVMSDWDATHSTVRRRTPGSIRNSRSTSITARHSRRPSRAAKSRRRSSTTTCAASSGRSSPADVIDHPQVRGIVDPVHGFEVSQKVEEGSAVLLRNQQCGASARCVEGAIDCSHRIQRGYRHDLRRRFGAGRPSGPDWRNPVAQAHLVPYLAARGDSRPGSGAQVSFSSGEQIDDAVAKAKQPDVAVVFAWQWQSEGDDLPNLSLPENQDALIAAVAQANPHTVVVLETGTAVKMPWLDNTAAVLEAWYGGSKGADAVARLLFGEVNPSGKLPMTFPRSENELPRTTIAQPPPPVKNGVLSFKVDYNIEGAAVGYKWYESQHKPVLFPFGFGLSYTTFKYSDLKVGSDGSP